MYGKTNAMNTAMYWNESYIGGSIKSHSYASNEKVKKISENKELFGAFIMLTVSAITMTCGILFMML